MSKFLKILKLISVKNYLRPVLKLNSVWAGSTYGGFYYLSQFLNDESIVYSFGIGEDISFDLDLIKNYKCNIHGFDPTPKSKKYISELNPSRFFTFHDFGISNKTEVVDFYLPIENNHVSGSLMKYSGVDLENPIEVKMKKLVDIVNILDHKHIDILKMDIEGAEYDVIEDIISSSIFINQILIEFHERFFKDGITKTKNAIKQLKNAGFEIFAVSDTFHEISFINIKSVNK